MYELKSVSPESVGIPSSAIMRIVDKIKKFRMNIHSFAFIRNGYLAAEAYAKPIFDVKFKHRLYSCSKSIVSIAIGKAVGEGLFSPSDKICDYFPEFIDEKTDKLILQTTIENMLTMSVPHLTDSYLTNTDVSWVESFFKVRGVKPSGTVFDYNSSASFVLGALIQKLTGKTFIEYLRPELDKIGVGEVDCVLSPDGYAWGSSGVICTLRDFARICLLVIDNGIHNGETLISSEYLKRATSKIVCNYTQNDYSPRRAEGYGYQFWITDKGYSAYGMGSQYAFFFPEKQLLFVCNGDTQVDGGDFCGEFLYEWVSEIYDEISCKPLDVLKDNKITKELAHALNGFSLPVYGGLKNLEYENEINGVVYELSVNPMGIKWFKIDFNEDYGKFTYENARGIKSISFGKNGYATGLFPEVNFYDKKVFTPSDRKQKYTATGEWVEDRKMLIRIYIVDSNCGNLFVTLGFKRDEVGMSMKKRAEFFLDDYQGYACGRRQNNML